MYVDPVNQALYASKKKEKQMRQKSILCTYRNRLAMLKRASVEQNSDVKRNDRDHMTMAEYKEYIYKRISKIHISPSLSKTNINVSISEDAFIKMKDNKEYEQQILALLERDLGGFYFGYAPEYCYIKVGADLKDYQACTGGIRSDIRQKRRQERDYEERKKEERKKRADKQLEEIIMKKQVEREYLNKLAGQKHLARRVREQALNEAKAMERAGFVVNSVELAMAAKAYEKHFDRGEMAKMMKV